MSLIPEFELGVYNAWILVLSFFVFCTGLPSLITRVFITNKNPKDSDEPLHLMNKRKNSRISSSSPLLLRSSIVSSYHWNSVQPGFTLESLSLY